MKRLKNSLSAMLAGVAIVVPAILCGCSIGFRRYERYDNAALYDAGNFTYAATAVKKIEIDWVSGSVEIVQSDAEQLSVSEDSIKDIDKQLHYYLDGTTLKLKFCKSGHTTRIEDEFKNLRVEIPASIELEIESVSAPITIGEAMLSSLSVETVSGDLTAEKLTAYSIDVESVSANVSLGMAAQTTAEIESVSGNLSFSLPSEMGAKIQIETVSGKFESKKEFGKNGKRYDVWGADGVSTECVIDIETVSGNVAVK